MAGRFNYKIRRLKRGFTIELVKILWETELYQWFVATHEFSYNSRQLPINLNLASFLDD